MGKEEWLRRCSAQFVTVGGLTKHDADYQANLAYESGIYVDFDKPEDCANEEMSYWD